MRIGLDANTALDPRNGAGHYTIDLIEELVRQAGEGDEVVVFHTGPEPAAPLAWLLRHERLVRVNVPASARRSSEWWRSIASPAIERKLPGGPATLDVLHTLQPPFLHSQARRKILTVRAIEADPDAKLPLAFRRSLLHADAVAVTSDGLRRELERRFARFQPKKLGLLQSRLHHVSPGVHGRFLTPPRTATVVGLCDAYPFLGEPYLLSPGGVANPERSLRLLIDACRLARDRDASLPPLVLLGRAGDTTSVAPILESAQAEGRVYWLQNLESDLLPALYRGAELLLYPGFDYAFGLPVLEAVAMGVPSIVGAACGAAEMLGAGVGVEVVEQMLTAESWASALLALHRDEGRRRALAEGGHARARSQTWEAVAKRHWELYREGSAER
jgi:glycosyltransferase involved in cell wall biosynthesis